MRVTLDQAIEIHAKTLKYRFGRRAPALANEKANCEGHGVWRRVAAAAEALWRKEAAICQKIPPLGRAGARKKSTMTTHRLPRRVRGAYCGRQRAFHIAVLL